MAGCVLLFFGLLRLGWIVEFIPYIPISAFVTAASTTIISTQIPPILGIPGINTRDPPYLILFNTIKGLKNISVNDASIGLSCLTLLFTIRTVCTRMELRHPTQKRMWLLVSSLRLTFTMLFFTFLSFLINRHRPDGDVKLNIVGHIDRGMSLRSLCTDPLGISEI